MGSVGDCFDHAMAESFFAILECELLDRTTLSTHADARAALFEFIEGGTTRGGVTPRSATGRHWSSNGSIRPPLWTVPGLWTPYGRPQVRWIPRCARDPHRPQESMLMMYTP